MHLAYNESVAYDLYRFDERAVQEKTVIKAPVRTKRKRAVNFQSVVSFVVVIATLSCILFGYVTITELNSEVNGLKKELSALEDEGRRLSLEIDRKTSLKNVEEYARYQLGMQDLQSYQIEYVRLKNSDKGVVVSSEQGISLSTVASGVSNTLNMVLDYIR